MLLFKGAREDDADLESMVEAKLLTREEVQVLSPASGTPSHAGAQNHLPSKSQMIFVWMCDLWMRALAPDQGGLGTSPIPNAAQLTPMVLRRCADGRGAAGGALALVFTQLPLPYVHLLSILVRFASVVNAINHGVSTGYTLSSPTCDEAFKANLAHTYRFELFLDPLVEECPPALYELPPVATVLILLSWLVSVLMYPIIYNGLFSIGVMLSNPLGNNSVNFAGSWYQHIMKSEVKGFYRCADMCRPRHPPRNHHDHPATSHQPPPATRHPPPATHPPPSTTTLDGPPAVSTEKSTDKQRV